MSACPKIQHLQVLDYEAEEILFTPAGGISAINVQDALEELDIEKEDTGTALALVVAHEGSVDPHPQYQRESERNAAGGYAGLDPGSIVESQVQFIKADVLAARPPPSIPGRMYFSTDTRRLSVVAFVP